jgi:hypothetical protein
VFNALYNIKLSNNEENNDSFIHCFVCAPHMLTVRINGYCQSQNINHKKKKKFYSAHLSICMRLNRFCFIWFLCHWDWVRFKINVKNVRLVNSKVLTTDCGWGSHGGERKYRILVGSLFRKRPF